MNNQIEVILVACLSDNYAYLLRSESTNMTAVVDVPDAAPILDELATRGWQLNTIFITHGHFDHVQGLDELKAKTGAEVIGPRDDAAAIGNLDKLVAGDSQLQWAGAQVKVIDVPGHCDVQIAFHFPEQELVFVGDALFSMGCGACFTGNYQLLQQSIDKIGALPQQTRIFVGHEYTAMCGARALKMEPDNQDIISRMQEVAHKRGQGEPTIPTTVAQELATNPFLRTTSASLRRSLGVGEDAPSLEAFQAVRDFPG